MDRSSTITNNQVNLLEGSSAVSTETNSYVSTHVSLRHLFCRTLPKSSQVQQTSDWKLELLQLPVGDVYSNRLRCVTATV